MGVVKQHNVKYFVCVALSTKYMCRKTSRAKQIILLTLNINLNPIIYSNHSYRPACFSFVYHPTPAKTSTRPAAVAHACSGAMGL